MSAPVDSADGIQQRVQAIAHSQVVPSAVELDRSGGGATLSLLLEGTVPGVEGRTAQALALLGDSAGSSDEPPEWWGTEPSSEHGVLVKLTHEISGLSRCISNLGSSLGTALIGSILISALATSFASGVATSDLPAEVQQAVAEATEGGVAIVPAASVDEIAEDAGLSAADADLTLLRQYARHLPMLFIVSDVELRPLSTSGPAADSTGARPVHVTIERAGGVRCERCWRYVEKISDQPASAGLCDRCQHALAA